MKKIGKKETAANGGRKGAAVKRFLALYNSNTRSSGRFNPENGRMHTEYSGLDEDVVREHLLGNTGIGAVPILDDDNCQWAAIDIDNHDDDIDGDIPILPIEEYIRHNKLPLVACRSKSGGVHCYLFLEKPLPAARIRATMAKWAAQLGYAGVEVFPKQSKLFESKESKKKQLGNWINLPYLGGGKTNRYAVYDGKQLTLEQFLDLAEKSRTNFAQLKAMAASEHPDAPPCIQKMMGQGVAQGNRNEALYNIVVYLKKAWPEEYEARAVDANKAVFTKPLGRSEMSRTIASAAKPDYGYRCNEEPIRSLCDREACLKRKFGITPDDASRLDTVDALPVFSDMVKFLSDPVRWEMKIDGVKVTNIHTDELLDFRCMRKIIAERLTRVVPNITVKEWERILSPIVKESRIMEVPDDASVSGVIRDRLREFAAKTDLTNRGEDIEDRKALLRGQPVVQVVGGERCVVMRGQDFVIYLKRTKSEELRGVNLWMAIKDMGVVSTKMRAGGQNINVWTIPVATVMEHLTVTPATEFKSDL